MVNPPVLARKLQCFMPPLVGRERIDLNAWRFLKPQSLPAHGRSWGELRSGLPQVECIEIVRHVI